jgi:hypothetical protein
MSTSLFVNDTACYMQTRPSTLHTFCSSTTRIPSLRSGSCRS